MSFQTFSVPTPPRRRLRLRLRLIASAAAVSVLSGCATFSADGGFGPVEQTAKQRLGKDLKWARSAADVDGIEQRVDELLKQPLSADNAVQLALLNNRGLQASFQELGIAEADLVQASRLPNPGFVYGRLKRGDEREIDRLFSFNLAHLIALPLVRQIEARRFATTQGGVTLEVLALAARTRRAYYTALATGQTERYMQQVKQTADAGAELARRMAQVGNFTKLEQAREHGFYAEATLNLARAQQAQTSARERLTRLLGLWGQQTTFTLPERLPDLPKSPGDQPDIEQMAMAQRIDVQAARLMVEATAKMLGLTKVTRFVSVLDLGYTRNTFNDGSTERGYEIAFEIPLFDWSGARVAKAEAIYMQSAQRAAQVAVEARSEVREAYALYRSAYDIARHYRDDIVPSAKRISDENVLRYNGMLIGVFELLADTRSQIASVNASIEALRDYWIAQADLDMALIGKPDPMASAPAATRAAAAGPAH